MKNRKMKMMKLYFWKPNQILMNRMLTYQILNWNQILKMIQKIFETGSEEGDDEILLL